MASGRPLSPSHTTMQTSSVPPVLDLGEDLEPELGTFTAGAGPQAQDLPAAVGGDPDGGSPAILERVPRGFPVVPGIPSGTEYLAVDGLRLW
jgi:hypothetical protein